MRRVGIKRITILSLLTCMVLNVQSSESTDEKTIIRLPDEYVVKNANVQSVRLGDLATSIQAPTPEKLQQLVGVELVEAPDEGEQVKLSKTQVHLAIRAAHYDFTSVLFEGAKITDVFGLGQKVTISSMVDAIHKKIKQETRWPDDEIVFRVLGAPAEDAWLPAKPYEIVVERVSPQLYGTSRYEVGFYVDQIQVDKKVFLVKVAHLREVFVPTTDIQRGALITADKLRAEKIEIDQEFSDRQYVDVPEELVGKRCRFLLRRNEPIRWNSLETNYVLRRGDMVQMIVRNNGLILQTTARAQSRGAPGEIIPVQTIGTGKIVNAKVISGGMVEMISS